ncbi:hypothetical protein [Burkholderia contaminans]|nr:hypothetical protein [Burkholderia contaminans]
MKMRVGDGSTERKGLGDEHSHLPVGGAECDEQYVLKNEKTGQPLVGVPYRIHTSSGRVFSGMTDSAGHTQRVATRYAEKLRIEIVEHGHAAR